MVYQVLSSSPDALSFATHPRARRGRGVLFATAPWVVYVLTLSGLFLLATRDLSMWEDLKRVAAYGALVTFALSLLCFWLGRRVNTRIDVRPQEIHIEETPALGPPRVTRLTPPELKALSLEPSLRSLGADYLLVAQRTDGHKLALAEGEPHSGQLHSFAEQMASITRVPLERPTAALT